MQELSPAATFSNLVSKKLPKGPPGPLSWDEFGKVLCNAASDMFGERCQPQQKPTVGSDPEVLALVEEIRKLRLKENAAKTRKQKAEACSTRRNKRRQLIALLKNKGREQLIARVEEIEAVKEDGRKMFAAVRALKLRTPTSLRIVDKKGCPHHHYSDADPY